jgi:putative endonuclease
MAKRKRSTSWRSSRPKPRRPSSGRGAERRAAWWYRLRGYRIAGTNVWVGRYELDVVAVRGRTVVFCEVKSKSGTRWGDPLEMVTPEKMRRIRLAAETWIAYRPAYRDFGIRFDIVAVRGRRLECVRGAF